MTENISRFIYMSRLPIILGPVLIHCHWAGFHSHLQYTLVEIGWITVPLFFFISGYLFFQNYDGTLACYRDKWKRRMKTLIIPYLLWNLIAYIFFAFIDKMIAPEHFLQSFLGLSEMAGGPADHPLWFLRNIIIYTLAAPILWRVAKMRWSGLIFGSLLCMWLLGLPILQHGIFIGALFFTGGGYISINNVDVYIAPDRDKRSLTFVASMFVILVLISNCLYTTETYLGKVVYNMMLLSGGVLTYDLFSLIKNDSKACRCLMGLGGMSFFVYCSHVFFIHPYHQIIKTYLGVTSMTYILVFVLVALSSILAGYCIKKMIPFVFGLLTGSRK